ncbi:MAG: hypothetical protein KDB14_28105 [Planctomycetales bacterium]|nr:hypothetical protein [Planctomycetales bacterium]
MTTNTGCLARIIGFGHYLAHGMPKLPAEYEGLEDSRAAVVCVAADTAYGPNVTSNRVARHVRKALAENVDDIVVVPEEEISDWLDHNDWSEVDYVALGNGVKADKVVAIELNAPIRFHEGPQLYRGSADYTVTVIDLKKQGKKDFRRRVSDFHWPAQARYGVQETQFEAAFLKRVGDRIAGHFYGLDPHEDIGQDTSDIGEF